LITEGQNRVATFQYAAKDSSGKTVQGTIQAETRTEAVTQLRGQAGDRQVAGAEVAVVSNGGLTPGSAMLFTTSR